MFRAYLFGGLTLTYDEVPLSTIPSRVARSLLAYLLAHHSRAHTRDLLAGAFWPDLTDSTARRRLSQTLWLIRKTLEPHLVLLTEGNTVQLNPDLPLWLDVEEFGRLVDWELGDRSPIHQSINLPKLNRAAELYQGDFLTGYYDDWLFPEREWLRELFLGALGQLVDGYKAQGEYEQALLHAGRLAKEDPWREEAHREVMRLCHLLGWDAEALKQFEICCRALAEELEVEPSPETVALAREIANRADDILPPILPQFSPAPAVLLLEDPAAPELPLVGREAEQTDLLAHVEALFQGLGGVVLVEGEAGVGKTRLLQAVASDARWRGAEVLWAGGQEDGPAMPYGPLLAALDEGFSPLRASQLAQLVEKIWFQVLMPLLPSLAAALPDLPLPPKLEPAQERDRLVVALAQVLTAWAQVTPLLLVLEDLHWAGEDALDLLTRLAPALGEGGVLLIGSYRSEEARASAEVWQKVQALDRAGVKHKLALGNLDAVTTGELIRRCLGMGRPAPLFESRLYQETQGNPLFVLETLRALHGEGLLNRDQDGQWSTPWDESTTDYAELSLPRAVEQTIARRLAALPPALEQTVNLAAVLGERFDFALLRAAAEKEPTPLLADLRELVQRCFVDETDQDYRFSHNKIRQVAYEGIAAPERVALHRRAAETFETLQPDQVAALAHHWTEAEVWDRAADYHQQAGDRAKEVYAPAEAVAHYTEALAALERLSSPPDLERIFDLRLAREATWDLWGEQDSQAKDLAALEALATQLAQADPQTAAQKRITIALRYGRFYTRTSDYPAALRHLETALALAQAAVERQAEALALERLGNVYLHLGDPKTTLALYQQELTIRQDLGDQKGIARNLNSCAAAYQLMGDNIAAQAHCEQVLALCKGDGNPQEETYANYLLGRILRYLGRLSQARAYVIQAIAFRRHTGERMDEAYYLLELAGLQSTLGEYPAARETLERAADLFRQSGERRGEGFSLADLGLVSLAQGQVEAAYEQAAQALDLLRVAGDRWGEAGALGHLALVLEGLNDLSAAADLFGQASAAKRKIEQHAWAVDDIAGLARIALARGQVAEAQDHVKEILNWIDQEGITGINSPFLAYFTAYRVLNAAGKKERARSILSEAYSLLIERADWLDDEATRRSYLENVAEHRELIAAYEKSQIGQSGRKIQVRLPRAKAPTTRPLTPDEWVEIAWTVDAPEDADIAGKVDRRRHRLLRLLREAADQAAAPAVRDLASALEVSPATLKRDLAALRQKGFEPKTRGSRKRI